MTHDPFGAGEDDDPAGQVDYFLAALQDVVLPAGLPVLPTLDLTADFVVAADPGEATGAWLDVVTLDSGRVGLVVGQVPGTGMGATAAAAAISAVLRASLACHEEIAPALQLGDHYARRSADARGTAVVVAILDPTTGGLDYSTAGHDAPVVVTGVDSGTRLQRTGNGPLGSLRPGAAPATGRHELGEDDLLAITSSSPRDDEDDWVGGLVSGLAAGGPSTYTADSASNGADPKAGSVASGELARTIARRQQRGAAALVVARRRHRRVDDLDLDLVVDSTTTARARRELQDWVEATGASSMDRLSLVHAAGELVANSVEHAYPERSTTTSVRIRGEHDATGVVTVTVVDRGRWRAPVEEMARGRGLAMAAGLVDELTVTHDEEGTKATVRHRLSVPLVADRTPAEPDPWSGRPLAITESTLGSVRLSGAFAADDVDEIQHALLVASRGGAAEDVVLDLTEVTSLSAGGVRLLDDLVNGAPTGNTAAAVTLLVRRGSAPHAELERAGVAYRAT